MTIRAADLALRNLGLDAANGVAVSDKHSDSGALHATHVIEFEKEGVVFAAIDTRVVVQVVNDEEPGAPLARQLRGFSAHPISIAMCAVVSLIVFAFASFALRLPQAATLVLERELVER